MAGPELFVIAEFDFNSIRKLGKLPGLVVSVKDSQSEPLSSDMGSIPGFT
jgi:hypothetical protein